MFGCLAERPDVLGRLREDSRWESLARLERLFRVEGVCVAVLTVEGEALDLGVLRFLERFFFM